MRQLNSRKVRSTQEARVLAAIPAAAELYESKRLPYLIEAEYIPDFYANGVCVELKEYITYQDVAKYEAIARCNTHTQIIFWVMRAEQRTLNRLRKTFKVYEGRYIPIEIIELLVEATMSKQKQTEQVQLPEDDGRPININPPVPVEPPAETPSELPSTPVPPPF